jgi:hypothetical protein
MAGVGQATQPDFVTFQLIRSDDTDGRIRLGNFYHAAYAIRKDPIVSLDNLAVFTIWRNARERKIVILHLCQKRLRMHQTNLLGICASIVLGDFYGSISAAIIDKNVFPVPIGLPQHTFNAICQELACVIERGHYTYEWV